MTPTETHYQSQDEFSTAPETEGRGTSTKYGVHAFDSLPTDLQNAALSAYVAALNKGWQVPEAEGIAREAVNRLSIAQAVPPEPTHEPQPGEEYDEEPIQETPATMPKIAKALFWSAGLMAVAYFVLQGFLGPATPLRAAIDARAAIAQELSVAVAKADASDKAAKADAKARDILRARYELAYKREACLVNGSCK
jgi:hypothetical protein